MDKYLHEKSSEYLISAQISGNCPSTLRFKFLIAVILIAANAVIYLDSKRDIIYKSKPLSNQIFHHANSFQNLP